MHNKAIAAKVRALVDMTHRNINYYTVMKVCYLENFEFNILKRVIKNSSLFCTIHDGILGLLKD